MQEMRDFPITFTPLSDEVARMLMTQYGPEANSDTMVTLRCDETLSIVDVARRSNVIVLTVKALGSDLVELAVNPSLVAGARFALVTLSQRQEAPALRIPREQLALWVAELA